MFSDVLSDCIDSNQITVALCQIVTKEQIENTFPANRII